MPTARMNVEAAPGLTALVIYLRPAPRAKLLSALADLGIFVTERLGTPGAQLVERVDICLVVANGSDHRAVSELADIFPTLVACLPEGDPAAADPAWHSLHCVTDADISDASTLREAARTARTMRAHVRPRSATVFGELELQLAPPMLRKGDVSVPLSQSEKELLRMLAASIGQALPLAELERGAALGAAVHPGFLKAVVLRLRRKVDELGGDPDLLHTVRGYGYSLLA